MSITSSFLLFLLCLSLMHALSARRLGALDNKNKLEKKLHFSIKNDMKNDFRKNASVVGQVKLKSTSSKELRSVKEEISGAVQRNKSSVSVSWQVPRGKHSEKHPGFNLDYSSPKTHPPSHN